MKFLTSRCGWIILNNALLNYENWILVIFLKFSFDALYWIICACVPQVEPVGSSYRAALHYGDHSGGDRGQRLTPHQPYHHTNHEGVTHCPWWLLILVLLSPIWFQSALPPCWIFFFCLERARFFYFYSAVSVSASVWLLFSSCTSSR